MEKILFPVMEILLFSVSLLFFIFLYMQISEAVLKPGSDPSISILERTYFVQHKSIGNGFTPYIN
jgi:hypothetical protein